MSIKEQKETEGGFLAFFVSMLVLGLIVGIIQEALSN